jgi:Na+-driven multidrug efflux pump
MTKALRVTMIVYGIIGILLGLILVILPDQMTQWFNAPVLNDYEKYLSASIGLANIAAGVFIIMAARDPIKNISWVKFAIVWALFWVVAVLYGLLRGYVDFSQEGPALIINVIFAALFFAFYPWRVKQAAALPAKDAAS